MERQCLCCKNKFRPDRYHPYQNYCFEEQCQRKRRSIWQKNKLETDSDYRENQSDAQELWKAKNPDYWKDYRSRHPEYVERNRQQQQMRRLRSKESSVKPVLQPDVAKMDVAPLQQVQLPLISGRYRLISLDKENVAKMDFAIVQLSIIEPVTQTG